MHHPFPSYARYPLPAVEAEKLSHSKEQAESSFEIRKKVVYAREFQTKRLAESRLHNNAQMRNKEVKQFCELNKEARRLIRMAIDKYSLSARSYFRILKVARTIADLAGAKDIKVEHLAEALQYRLRVF